MDKPNVKRDFTTAYEMADAIFHHFPMDDAFDIAEVIEQSTLPENIKLAALSNEAIRSYLVNRQYIIQFHERVFKLTALGREVQRQGGPLKYEKKAVLLKDAQEESEIKKLAAILQDMQAKGWTYKFRWLPIVISLAALVISGYSLSITATKKQTTNNQFHFHFKDSSKASVNAQPMIQENKRSND